MVVSTQKASVRNIDEKEKTYMKQNSVEITWRLIQSFHLFILCLANSFCNWVLLFIHSLSVVEYLYSYKLLFVKAWRGLVLNNIWVF